MEEYHKMLYAWNRLLNSTNAQKIHYNINKDAIEYKKLKEAASKVISAKMKIILSKNHPHLGTHWWKDPNDKTKSMRIKEGDPVPEGWVRGKWQFIKTETLQHIKEFYKNHKHIRITNGIINMNIPKGEPIPDGFWIGIVNSKRGTDKIIAAVKNRFAQKRLKIIPLLREQYNFLQNHGWDEFVKKYSYTRSKTHFMRYVRYYLKEEYKSCQSLAGAD